jgi:hypothetical protein
MQLEKYIPALRLFRKLKTDLPVEFGSTVKIGTVPIGATFTIDTELLAASVDKWIWIAPFACKVVSVREVHSVVGGASAAVRPRKVTDTSAPGAAASTTVKELSAAIDLTATINTVVAPTVTATTADITLAAGDKIGLDFSGTLTGLVGALTIELQRV